MDHNTVLITLNVVVLLGEIALGVLLKNYLPAYATEKGKNLATKEDIEEITRKVEGVKTENAKQLEEIAHQNRQLLDYMNRRHQLRIAALDKRLEVHQQAYALWWNLTRQVYGTEEFKKVARECAEWWGKNCLYLEADARRAFHRAWHSAIHTDAIEVHRNPRGLPEVWRSIVEAGDVIVKAMELPSLGEDEHLPLKTKEEEGGQTTKPNSAG